MPLLWTGLIFVLLKLSHVGPVAQWPWWGVLSPLFAAVVWFEWLETPLGRHPVRKAGLRFTGVGSRRVSATAPGATERRAIQGRFDAVAVR